MLSPIHYGRANSDDVAGFLNDGYRLPWTLIFPIFSTASERFIAGQAGSTTVTGHGDKVTSLKAMLPSRTPASRLRPM